MLYIWSLCYVLFLHLLGKQSCYPNEVKIWKKKIGEYAQHYGVDLCSSTLEDTYLWLHLNTRMSTWELWPRKDKNKQSKTKDATAIPLTLVRFSPRKEGKGNPPKGLTLGYPTEYSHTPFICALKKHALVKLPLVPDLWCQRGKGPAGTWYFLEWGHRSSGLKPRITTEQESTWTTQRHPGRVCRYFE